MMGKNYGGNVAVQLQPNSGESQLYGSHMLDSQPNLKCIEYPPSLSSSQPRQAHNQVCPPLYLGSRDLYDM